MKYPQVRRSYLTHNFRKVRDNLFRSVIEDLSLNALFLKNVQEICLTVLGCQGEVDILARARRHVERLAPNLDKVIITDLTSGKTLASFYSSTLSLSQSRTDEDDKDSEEDEEEELLFELSKKLKTQPIISVAGYIPDPDLKDDSAKYLDRMSVLLPLPNLPGTRTGLPVVVNGFFALSEDRRAVKYQTSDDSSDQVHSFQIL